MANQKKNSGPIAWLRRAFFGGSNELAREMESQNKDDINKVEEIITPGKQAFRNFMERPLAVIAMCVVIAMFILVFVGPLFMPKYTDSYTEVTQKSVSPGMNMMKVPKEMSGNVRSIDSYGSFTVGVSGEGKTFVWGDTKLGTTGIDIGEIPEEVRNDKILMAAAGIDHIIAISESGKVYGWGSNMLGQFVSDPSKPQDNPNIAYEPEELVSGTIDVSHIKKLTCGYQCSALLMDDGTFYLWGNRNAYANIDSFLNLDTIYDIDFTLNYIVGLAKENANMVYCGIRGMYSEFRPNMNSKAISSKEFLKDRSIVAVDAGASNICVTLDDGSIGFTGDFALNVTDLPELDADENIISVVAGNYHYTVLTDKGHVYSCGQNVLDQCELPKKDLSSTTKLFSGAFQSYAVDENNALVAKWGLKGYLFGTDTTGADIFARIINGGKMTMTVGAVAVIISSVIGIIIGCISGYFGGKVDILLMRVTEIFSAIPFIPFAMILSAVMSQMTLSEDARIFIIMAILGVLTWPGLAHLVRAQVLVARENEYVVAAQAMGLKSSRIAFKHILPNVISVIIVSLTLDFATCMLTESSLSYLGFGVNYPRPTWGNMLSGSNNATIITNYWWQWVFTSIFLAITTICINIVGDTLRDVLDPKSSLDK